MLTNNFVPQMTLSTRLNQKSATLIDNTFLKYHEHQCISGNLTTYVSDHLPKFIIVENLLENIGNNDDMMTKLNIGIIKTLTQILLNETLMK